MLWHIWVHRCTNITEIFVFYCFVLLLSGLYHDPKNHDRKKRSNSGSLQVGGKGGVIPLLTWQPILGDEVTCNQLHCIPYRRIAPGVSQAFLTKPLKNGSAAQVLWGVYGSCDNLFFSGEKRWGALANTKSHQTKFRDNGVGALLLLFFKRFSAVPQTKFSEFFSEIFKLKKKKVLSIVK